MSLDPKVVEAIRTATNEAGQPTALARRLIAWLEAVADGNADINDVAASDRYLEVIYDAVALGKADKEDEAGPDEGDDDEEEYG